MSFAEEEARAEAYRAQELARQTYRRALVASLEGDPDELEALQDRWQPLIDYFAQQRSNAGGNYDECETERYRKYKDYFDYERRRTG